jgi:hypothetical protein
MDPTARRPRSAGSPAGRAPSTAPMVDPWVRSGGSSPQTKPASVYRARQVRKKGLQAGLNPPGSRFVVQAARAPIHRPDPWTYPRMPWRRLWLMGSPARGNKAGGRSSLVSWQDFALRRGRVAMAARGRASVWAVAPKCSYRRTNVVFALKTHAKH